MTLLHDLDSYFSPRHRDPSRYSRLCFARQKHTFPRHYPSTATRNTDATTTGTRCPYPYLGTSYQAPFVAAQMVDDVRDNIAGFRRSCSVCYMITGEVGTTHVAGKSCMKIPLDDISTPGWKAFKNTLAFVGGIFCFHCHLPTVRAIYDKVLDPLLKPNRVPDQIWRVLSITARTPAPRGTLSAPSCSRSITTGYRSSRHTSGTSLVFQCGRKVLMCIEPGLRSRRGTTLQTTSNCTGGF